MLKNITVATKENINYYEIMKESCKRNNIELVVLGLGQKWTGFSMKFELWLEYLNTLPDNEIVMINDDYDVIMLEDSNTIKNKFKQFNKHVVFSVQKGMLINLSFPRCRDDVICVGNIIGYVKYIKKIIELIVKHKNLWKKYDNDDQIIFNNICKIEPYLKNNIGLDKNQDIFFVTSADDLFNINYLLSGQINNLFMENGKLLNKNKTSISVIHLAANVNFNKYLNYLNYNYNSVNHIRSYKYIQVFNLFKQIIKRYWLYILLIIIIIILLKNKLLK